MLDLIRPKFLPRPEGTPTGQDRGDCCTRHEQSIVQSVSHGAGICGSRLIWKMHRISKARKDLMVIRNDDEVFR